MTQMTNKFCYNCGHILFKEEDGKYICKICGWYPETKLPEIKIKVKSGDFENVN